MLEAVLSFFGFKTSGQRLEEAAQEHRVRVQSFLDTQTHKLPDDYRENERVGNIYLSVVPSKEPTGGFEILFANEEVGEQRIFQVETPKNAKFLFNYALQRLKKDDSEGALDYLVQCEESARRQLLYSLFQANQKIDEDNNAC